MRNREQLTGQIPAIVGFGHAVPSRLMTNADLDAYLGKKVGFTDRAMRASGAGMGQRYWVRVGEEATSDLAVRAIQESLALTGIDKEALTAIRLGSTSPDMPGVSTVAIVQDKLNLPNDVMGSNNADACPGWTYTFYNTVTDLSSPYGRGGVQAAVGAEVISTNLSPRVRDSLLFGDAAGAALVTMVTPDPGVPINMGFAFGLDGKFADDLGVKAGGSRRPTSLETVQNDEHALTMNGPVIHEQAVLRMKQVAEQALKKAKMPIEEVDLFVPHQANLAIMRDTAEALGIPMKKVVVTIDKYGNTSTSTVPVAMYEAYVDGRMQRNHKVLWTSFGAGLNYNGGFMVMNGLQKPVGKSQKYF